MRQGGFILVFIVAIATVGLWNLHAHAQEGLGERIIATGADIEVVILPAEAAFTSEIRLVVPSIGIFPIATSHETSRVIHVGVIPAGLELIFEIFVQDTGDIFRMGPSERNPDGLAHATVAKMGPNTWTIGFEDLFGGGDFDFNDIIFQVRPASVLMNNTVSFKPLRRTFILTPDPSGCPEGFVGTFSFEARLSNINKQHLTNLFSTVTVLTEGNLLQNAAGGPGGLGAQLAVPSDDGFSDGVLSPKEFVDVPFVICLTNLQAFILEVDVLGAVE
jgi:hypothetical protein